MGRDAAKSVSMLERERWRERHEQRVKNLDKANQARAHKPNDDTRMFVGLGKCRGLSDERIARVIGVDPTTLRKHYETELETGRDTMNLHVGMVVYQQALEGNTVQGLFYLKCNADWQETSVVVHEKASDVDKMSKDELREIVAKHARQTRIEAGKRKHRSGSGSKGASAA